MLFLSIKLDLIGRKLLNKVKSSNLLKINSKISKGELKRYKINFSCQQAISKKDSQGFSIVSKKNIEWVR